MSTSGGSSGGGAVHVGTVSYTAGNISFTSVTAGSFTELATLTGGPGAGGLDCSVVAANGDLVMVVPNFLANPATSIATDVKTVAGGRWVSSGTTTGATQGVAGWYAGTPSYDSVSGPVGYTVQSSDISAGSVKFRPYVFAGSTSTHTVFASTSLAFFFTVYNITALAIGT